MAGSAVYGGVLGITFAILISAAPRWGMAACLAVLGLHSIWGALTCWRRTGLVVPTTGIGIAGVLLLGTGLFIAAGHPISEWRPAQWAAWLACATADALLVAVESRLHPDAWAEWKRYMAHMSAWDIALGRHFPPLRARRERPIP